MGTLPCVQYELTLHLTQLGGKKNHSVSYGKQKINRFTLPFLSTASLSLPLILLLKESPYLPAPCGIIWKINIFSQLLEDTMLSDTKVMCNFTLLTQYPV